MSYRFQIIATFFLMIGLFVIDQMTKYWAQIRCVQEQVINRFFSCELHLNRGISWSMLHSEESSIFFIVSCMIAIVILLFIKYMYRLYKKREPIIGAGLVLAGALSNFFDRMMYGAVVDFIVVHAGAWSFPVFNIADISICLGILLMICTVDL